MRSWPCVFRIKNRPGFTLIEIIVAVTIFSIIAAGIGATFMSGLKIWTRVKTRDFSRTDLLLGLEKVSRDLRQSVNVSPVGYTGTAGEFTFSSVSGNSIVKVFYRFNSTEKALVRGEKKLLMKDLIEEKKPASDTGYTERNTLFLDDLSFSYFYFDDKQKKYIWADMLPWELKAVPRAVRMNGKLKNEEFSRTVFIPAS